MEQLEILAGKRTSCGVQVMLVADYYVVLIFPLGIGKGVAVIAVGQSDEISRNS